MKKFYNKLFLSTLATVFFFASANAYAQEINFQDTYKSTINTVNLGHETEPDEYNSARSQAVNANTAVANAIIYIAPQTSENYAAILESDTISPDMKRGLYGMVEDGVYSMYQSQPYVNVYAHLVEEWVPGNQESTSLYAYESGYDELMSTGINNVWDFTRNVTYVFFILIMIIVGFMIMFRSKLGGQTVVSLANSLPNIIIALIGVTFSFAIAGIIIDIGGLIMGILLDIFSNLGSSEGIIHLNSIFSLFKTMVPQSLFNSVSEYTGNAFGLFPSIGGFAVLMGLLLNPSGVAVLGIMGLILILIIIIIGTIGVFMVFVTLVKAYLGILIQVVTGPFQIALSAFPGKGVGFINWIKAIARNVLVYPITFAILNLPAVIYQLNGGELTLPGPDSLTLPTGGDTTTGGINFAGHLTVFIVQILVLFVASKADKYALAILPATSSREATAAGQEARAAIGKIPIVGGLLVKK
jgi:hypothetical protein